MSPAGIAGVFFALLTLAGTAHAGAHRTLAAALAAAQKSDKPVLVIFRGQESLNTGQGGGLGGATTDSIQWDFALSRKYFQENVESVKLIGNDHALLYQYWGVSDGFSPALLLSPRGAQVFQTRTPWKDNRPFAPPEVAVAEEIERLLKEASARGREADEAYRTAVSRLPSGRALFSEALVRFRFDDARKIADRLAQLKVIDPGEADLLIAQAYCVVGEYAKAGGLLGRLSRRKDAIGHEATLWQAIASFYSRKVNAEALQILDGFLAKKMPGEWAEKGRALREKMANHGRPDPAVALLAPRREFIATEGDPSALQEGNKKPEQDSLFGDLFDDSN